MEKRFLIQHQIPLTDESVFKTRMQSLGRFTEIFEGTYVVESNKVPKDIYEYVSVGNEDCRIFVAPLATGVYGRMPTTLWDWFRADKDKTV